MTEQLHFWDGLPQTFTAGHRDGSDSIALAREVYSTWDPRIRALLEAPHAAVHKSVYWNLSATWAEVSAAIERQDVGTLFAGLTIIVECVRQIEMTKAYGGGIHKARSGQRKGGGKKKGAGRKPRLPDSETVMARWHELRADNPDWGVPAVDAEVAKGFGLSSGRGVRNIRMGKNR